MTDIDDAGYYRRRAETARQMAERAHDRGIAAIHREMAELYEALVVQSSRPRPRLTVVPRR